MAWGFIWWGFSRLGLDLVGFSRARHAYIHGVWLPTGSLILLTTRGPMKWCYLVVHSGSDDGSHLDRNVLPGVMHVVHIFTSREVDVIAKSS